MRRGSYEDSHADISGDDDINSSVNEENYLTKSKPEDRIQSEEMLEM